MSVLNNLYFINSQVDVFLPIAASTLEALCDAFGNYDIKQSGSPKHLM